MLHNDNNTGGPPPSVTNDLPWIALFGALGSAAVLVYAWADPVWGPVLSEVAADFAGVGLVSVVLGAVYAILCEAIL